MSVEVEMNFDKFQKEFEREISNLVWRAAKVFRDAITQLLSQSGKSNVKAPHNYSKAGQIPHNMTGRLANSWKATSTRLALERPLNTLLRLNLDITLGER